MVGKDRVKSVIYTCLLNAPRTLKVRGAFLDDQVLGIQHFERLETFGTFSFEIARLQGISGSTPDVCR